MYNDMYEVIYDLSWYACSYVNEHDIQDTFDSRELYSCIVVWAYEFECDPYDNYIDEIQKFAQEKISGYFENR